VAWVDSVGSGKVPFFSGLVIVFMLVGIASLQPLYNASGCSKFPACCLHGNLGWGVIGQMYPLLKHLRALSSVLNLTSHPSLLAFNWTAHSVGRLMADCCRLARTAPISRPTISGSVASNRAPTLSASVVYAYSRWMHQTLLMLFVCLFVAFLAGSAQAQQTSIGAGALTPQELAKSVHNPFEDFVKLPFQSTTGFNIGSHHEAGENLNFQPLLPFRLTRDFDLIARPSPSMAYLPSPHEQFGLQDLQTSFFLTPHSANRWIWGIGPIFQFPTATTTDLGTGRWSAGPTAALIYSEGPWFNGLLAYHLMSFAGNHDRGSVNQTYFEPEVSYNLDSGWYADVDPPITFDWATDAANGWTLPMGADIGNAFNVNSQSMSLQVGCL
jgi:hypothetical protein